jgi:hypothetical protein
MLYADGDPTQSTGLCQDGAWGTRQDGRRSPAQESKKLDDVGTALITLSILFLISAGLSWHCDVLFESNTRQLDDVGTTLVTMSILSLIIGWFIVALGVDPETLQEVGGYR